jgi:hypothetical protein
MSSAVIAAANPDSGADDMGRRLTSLVPARSNAVLSNAIAACSVRARRIHREEIDNDCIVQ